MTINHPPMNLLDVPLVKELSNFLDEAQSDDAVRVIVFESDDPEYFLAHDNAHDAFMTLPAYAIPSAGEARHLGRDPKPYRVGLGVRKHDVRARQGSRSTSRMFSRTTLFWMTRSTMRKRFADLIRREARKYFVSY